MSKIDLNLSQKFARESGETLANMKATASNAATGKNALNHSSPVTN
jgi:hypothetical protein